jgi:2-dehydropantoate 2-reductase
MRRPVDADADGTDLTAWMVGLGGVGSVVAGRMAASKLLLVDLWDPNVAAIRSDGLTVTYPDARITRSLPACTIDELAAGYADEYPPDVVLLAVKSYQTRAAIEAIAPYLRRTSVVVSLQNGMNEELLAELIGLERTIGATSMLDGRLVAPGCAIQVKPTAAIVMGELKGPPTDRLYAIQTMLLGAAEVRLTRHIWSELWTKLVRNCMINAISAATNLPIGLVVKDSILLDLAVRLGCEAAEVASSLRVALVDEHLFGRSARLYLSKTATARCSIGRAFRSAYLPFETLRPSMLQDLDQGRQTEIAHMNGYVIRKGREAGVATPVNSALVDAVQRREAGAPHFTAQEIAGRLLR